LILRFCCPEEINQKRQKNLQIKATFLAKINYLKLLGMKQDIVAKIDSWVDESLDYFSQQADKKVADQAMVLIRAKSLDERTTSEHEKFGNKLF